MTPNDQERIGVYVCHCGTNIAGIVDVAEVAKWAAAQLKHHGVVISRDYKFMCSSLGQELIEKDIKELGLNRVVVAACSPHLHEKTFRTACANAGLNPFMCEMVSIREQVSWVHTDKAVATEKAKAMVSGGVERVRHHVPLEEMKVPIHPEYAGRGRRHRRHPERPGDRERRLPCLPGGARAVHRRSHGAVRQDLPDPGLLGLYSHAEDGLGGITSEHHAADLERGRKSGRIRRQLSRSRSARRRATIKEDLCTGCGICQEKCPKKVIDEVFEAGLGYRKAVYTPFAQAVPNFPVMDKHNCTYYHQGHLQGLREILPDRSDRLRSAG